MKRKMRQNVWIFCGAVILAAVIFGRSPAGDKPPKPTVEGALKHLGAVRKAIQGGDNKTALAELDEAEAILAKLKKPARPAVVNVKCPIMGSKVDPGNVPENLYRQFKGQGVGFCCAGCPAAWDKLSDAEKAAKLKTTLPKQERPAAKKPSS